jgi:hypothetical protein
MARRIVLPPCALSRISGWCRGAFHCGLAPFSIAESDRCNHSRASHGMDRRRASIPCFCTIDPRSSRRAGELRCPPSCRGRRWVPCSPRLNSIAAIVANAVQSWLPRPNIISSGRRSPKSWSPAAPHAKRRSPFEKWTLPTSCRRARRIRRLEIVQHQFTIFAFQVGHAVLCCHNRERLFPLPAIHALRGDQLEAMTCGTGIERFLASWSRGKFLRAFIAWSELLRLSEASRQGEKCDHEKQRP